MDKTVIVRGGGDLASGTIYKLWQNNYKVLVLEISAPSAIRRKVSFCECIYQDSVCVENATAVKVNNLDEIKKAWQNNQIPVAIDPKAEWIKSLKPDIVIDAVLAKKNLGMTKDLAPLTIALGPGFEAGNDVDVVIETMRGDTLGKIITKGFAMENTGIPGVIAGYSKERVIHSPCAGIINNKAAIGDIVKADQIIAEVQGDVTMPIKATIDGRLRGLIRNNYSVSKGFKIADIDPRLDENWELISDKAQTIANSVLEVIKAN
ncbi:MAG: molybdenum hydroxylase [Epulopiscium sp. Nuni2H_MBin003]|nr:MAG: molybdenum hydroxylase [Epulopiscium sp. Nuni2H_MBin003]